MNTEKISFTLICISLFLVSLIVAQLKDEFFLMLLFISYSILLYSFLHIVRMNRQRGKRVEILYLN